MLYPKRKQKDTPKTCRNKTIEQKQLDEISSKLHVPPQIPAKVYSQRYLTYNTASKLHSKRFHKLLEKLQTSTNTVNTDEQQNTTSTQDTNQQMVHRTPPNHQTQMSHKTPPDIKLIWSYWPYKQPQHPRNRLPLERSWVQPFLQSKRTHNYCHSTDLWTKYDGNSSESQAPRTPYTPISSPIHKPNTSTSQLPQMSWKTSSQESTMNSMSHLENLSHKRNVSNADKKVIKDLKEKDLVCLPSDKGTEFLIIQNGRYKQHLTFSMILTPIKRCYAWLLKQ